MTTETAESVLDEVGDWYYHVIHERKTLEQYIDYANQAMAEIRPKIPLDGKLEKAAAEMPWLVDVTFRLWQEAEAVLEDSLNMMKKHKRERYMDFKSTYDQTMSTRDMDKFIDGEADTVLIQRDINTVGFLRNQMGGLSKALETKQYQISNITKMRAAGLHDDEIRF